MKNAIESAVLLIGAALLCTIGVSAARADFTFIVDCHGINGLPSWSAGDHLTVIAHFTDGQAKGWNMRLDSSECARDNSEVIDYYGPYTENSVASLELNNFSSSNAVWIDKLTLSGIIGGTVTVWDHDDQLGFCFSSSPNNDFNATYNLPNGTCRNDGYFYK